jgi:hypothetical protein
MMRMIIRFGKARIIRILAVSVNQPVHPSRFAIKNRSKLLRCEDLQRGFVGFASTDADYLLDRGDKNFAIADFAGMSSLNN